MVFANICAICATASCCCEEEEDEDEDEDEDAFGNSKFGNSGKGGKSMVPNGVSILFDDGASVSIAFNRKTDDLCFKSPPVRKAPRRRFAWSGLLLAALKFFLAAALTRIADANGVAKDAIATEEEDMERVCLSVSFFPCALLNNININVKISKRGRKRVFFNDVVTQFFLFVSHK